MTKRTSPGTSTKCRNPRKLNANAAENSDERSVRKGSNPTVTATFESRVSLVRSAETGLVQFGSSSIVATVVPSGPGFFFGDMVTAEFTSAGDDRQWGRREGVSPGDCAVLWQQTGNGSVAPSAGMSMHPPPSSSAVPVGENPTGDDYQCGLSPDPFKEALATNRRHPPPSRGDGVDDVVRQRQSVGGLSLGFPYG